MVYGKRIKDSGHELKCVVQIGLKKKVSYEDSQSVAELMQRLGSACSCRVSRPDWKKLFANLCDLRCRHFFEQKDGLEIS